MEASQLMEAAAALLCALLDWQQLPTYLLAYLCSSDDWLVFTGGAYHLPNAP